MLGGWKKLCKDYDIQSQSGFGGTHGLWLSFDAVHKKTGVLATAWVLEKKPIEKAWFKKDAAGNKKLLDLLHLEPLPPAGAKAGLSSYERLEEDSSYLVYVTERVVGTLLSMYYVLGDLTLAKNNAVTNQGDEEQKKLAAKLLRYTSPDNVLYGVATLFGDLSALHSAGICHGNLTPANIAVTAGGEWRLCGFSFSENQAVQFEFNNDYAPFFRPSGAFMTPRQASARYSNVQTDCSQVFNSIFATFGQRQPHYDFSKDKREKLPNGDTAVSFVAEKMMAVCTSGQAWSMSPQNAIQHANLNERFWAQFASTFQQYYPLQYLQQIMQVIGAAIREQATGAQIAHQLRQTPFCGVAMDLANLEALGAFMGRISSEISEAATTFLSKSLPALLTQRALTVDFVQISLLERLVSLLSCKDFHQHAIRILIQLNETMKIPAHQLFLLFEPIVISETLSKYRSQYPQAAKSGPLAAWSGVQLELNGDRQGAKVETMTVKYTSPYNDVALEPKMKEKDRERFTPNFDKELNEKGRNVHHGAAEAIYSNLLFFFGPRTGGRSHYYTLNFILGCIACDNEATSESVLKYLADSVVLLTEKNWMMEETMLGATKLSNAMTDLRTQVTSLSAKEEPAALETAKDNQKPQLNYKQPITSVLAPTICAIVKQSTNGAQIANALTCLGKIINYFTDDQISRVLLPAINEGLDNIQKYPKGIVGFAEFSRVIYRRCSARTVATLFLTRLMRMCYVPELTGSGLETTRQICDELYQFFTEDVYTKAQQGDAPQPAQTQQQEQQQQYAQPQQQQYSQQPQQSQDPWAQQQQQQPAAKANDVWGQPSGPQPDPWAQSAATQPAQSQDPYAQTGYGQQQQDYSSWGQQDWEQSQQKQQSPADLVNW